MVFTNYPIEIEYKGNSLKGDCTIIKREACTEMPYKYPIYRVAFGLDTIKPDIYLFYKTGKAEEPFFWYKTENLKNKRLWPVIAEELERNFLTA